MSILRRKPVSRLSSVAIAMDPDDCRTSESEALSSPVSPSASSGGASAAGRLGLVFTAVPAGMNAASLCIAAKSPGASSAEGACFKSERSFAGRRRRSSRRAGTGEGGAGGMIRRRNPDCWSLSFKGILLNNLYGIFQIISQNLCLLYSLSRLRPRIWLYDVVTLTVLVAQLTTL